MKYLVLTFSCILLFFLQNCKKAESNNDSSTAVEKESVVKTEDITYNIDGNKYKSFVAFRPEKNATQPVVFVIPEWWGLNDYAKSRAKQLAELGYFAFAIDYYGDGKVVDQPADAEKLASQFYQDPAKSKIVFDAAKSQLSKFANVDSQKVAVIGYCFGGAQALNMARQDAGLKGAISFHGNLMTGVKPAVSNVKIFVANGADDTFVSKEEIAAFKKEMDSAQIDYKFVDYPGALHSFTNPAATEAGKKFNMKIAYNKEADEKSWNEMKAFLSQVFK